MRRALTLIAAAVMVATSASAAERTGWYIGGDVGQSNWNLSDRDANDLTNIVADAVDFYGDVNVTDVSNKFSDTDTTYSLFVGYQIAPWFALLMAA